MPRAPPSTPQPDKRCVCCAQLDMATFAGGSFYVNGSAMPASMQPAVMQTTVASMTTASAAQNATISTLQADKAALQADKAALQADKTTMTTTAAAKDATIIELRATKGAAEQDVPEEKMPTWAIAIIVVVGAMFLLVMVILGVVVSK